MTVGLASTTRLHFVVPSGFDGSELYWTLSANEHVAISVDSIDRRPGAVLSFEVTAAVGQRARAPPPAAVLAPLPADDVADDEEAQLPRGGAWRLGRRRSLSAALAADPAPGDDDAVVRFSFNVGADGKLEGAFRIADKVESAVADADVAEAAARIGWAPSASARPGAWSSLWRRLVLCEPSRAHRFRAAVRAYEWSEARRLALTIEEAAYVARSMARKDALDRALWSGDTREAARHARTAAERAAIGAYASGQAAGLKQVRPHAGRALPLVWTCPWVTVCPLLPLLGM